MILSQSQESIHWMSFGITAALLFVILAFVFYSRLPSSVKVIIVSAVCLRVLGSIIRYKVLFEFYDGSGDARVYFKVGLRYAELFKQLDFSVLVDSTRWWGGSWWGTEFVRMVSGLVLTVIGPSLFNEFVVFSLLSFVGLVCFGVAFRRSYPYASYSPYVLWIWLFPSLWYWPSSVGKEALIILGLGLAMLGYVGRRERIQWVLLSSGVFLAFAVRPQVAGILVISLIIARWVSFSGTWNLAKVFQGIVLLIVGLMVIGYSMRSVGIDQFDVEGIQSFVEGDKAREVRGGTHVNPVGVQVLGIPAALLNILFRPFPWEASNVMVLISSLEVISLWMIVFLRRRNLMTSLKSWRSDTYVTVSLVFILIYAIGLGMMIVNMGIIARQRIFLFPFLFVLLEAKPTMMKRSLAKKGYVAPRKTPSEQRLLQSN